MAFAIRTRRELATWRVWHRSQRLIPRVLPAEEVAQLASDLMCHWLDGLWLEAADARRQRWV